MQVGKAGRVDGRSAEEGRAPALCMLLPEVRSDVTQACPPWLPILTLPRQVHLAKVFGPESIPDVEFVIGTSDSPSVTMEPGRLPPPIFRWAFIDSVGCVGVGRVGGGILTIFRWCGCARAWAPSRGKQGAAAARLHASLG